MNSVYDLLLVLLQCAVNKSAVPETDCEADWDTVYSEACAHGVAAVIYSTVEKLPAGQKPPPELLAVWKSNTLSLAVKQMSMISSLFSVLEKAKNDGFTPIVLKGPVLGELYPEPLTRCSGDIDILIDQKDEGSLLSIFRSHGCLQETVSVDNQHEHTYILNTGIRYEVHRRLWEEKINTPRYKALQDAGLTSPDSFIRLQVMGRQVLTLGHREHLIYMIYHMAKHFVVNGMGIRLLTDITLYYNAYKSEISLEKLWEDIENIGYKSFCESVFSLCIKLFSMDSSIYPDYLNHDELSEKMILKDIWEGGIFGKHTAARELSGRFLRQYYENEEKKLPKNKFMLLLALLVPTRGELERIDFISLSDIKLVAWFQRTKHLISRWFQRKTRGLKNCTMKERMDCSMQRISMLEKVGLLK